MLTPRKTSGDYEVGYGKPPVRTRFAKGQSGNPRGRSKKGLDIKGLLEAMTEQKVSVSLGGRKVKISSLQAMLQSNYGKALRGDPRAFDRFLKLLDRYGIAAPKEEIQMSGLDETDDDIIAAFLRKQGPEEEAA